MQWLVSIIFNRETHLPSSVKLWQTPHPAAEPNDLPVFLRDVPLEAHETSYLAASASVFSLSKTEGFIVNH
jgi:hypothetical protein